MDDDRAKLEKLASLTRDHIALLDSQKQTIGKMVRACVQRLKSPDPAKRREAIKGLTDLADMLEKTDG